MAKSNPNSAEAINTKLRGGIAEGFDRGPTQQSYSGLGAGSKEAIGGLLNNANQNTMGLNRAADFNRDLLGSGGLTGPQNEAMDYYSGVMRGGMEDEGYQRLRQNAMDDARTAVNRQFGASGRFGSSMHARDTAEGIFDAAAGLDYRNLQRQDAAAQGLFGMAQTGTANSFGAADRAGTLYENALLPYTTRIQANSLLDTDQRAREAFDPQYEHLLKYQGLLGNNAAGPQPAKQPGFMDYAGLGLGLLGSFL